MVKGWNEADRATVKRMADKGYSSRQISEHLGNKSRAAVIALCRRQGWRLYGTAQRDGVDPPLKPVLNAQPKRKQAAKKPAAHPKVYIPKERPYTPGTGASLLQLGAHDCKFPITPFGDRDHRFCGAPQAEDSVYCQRHHKLCRVPYVVANARQRARVPA